MKKSHLQQHRGPESGTESSSYRQRGKPERLMAEIRREILGKILVRMKEEQLADRSLKDLGNGT
jgi:hypothetical protein